MRGTEVSDQNGREHGVNEPEKARSEERAA